MKQSTFLALGILVLLWLIFPVSAAFSQPTLTQAEGAPTETPFAYPPPETPLPTEAYPAPGDGTPLPTEAYPAPDGPTPGQGGIEWFGLEQPATMQHTAPILTAQTIQVSWITRATWAFFEVIRSLP